MSEVHIRPWSNYSEMMVIFQLAFSVAEQKGIIYASDYWYFLFYWAQGILDARNYTCIFFFKLTGSNQIAEKYLGCRKAKDSVTCIKDFFLIMLITFTVTGLHNAI